MATNATIWVTPTDEATGVAAERAAEADFLLLPRGDVFDVGRVVDGEVVWIEQVEAVLLPDRDRLDAASDEEVTRIDDAPDAVRALEAIEEADTQRGG